jgi:putative transposase
MQLSNDIRHGRHCVPVLHAHLVFVTKYRRKVFDGDALQRLQAIFEKVCLDFQAQPVERNGEAEHVHLLIHYPPKHSVSSLVNSLKGVSSRLLRIERPDMEKRYWNNVLWSPSYFAASCGGAPLSIIKQYVEQEKNPLYIPGLKGPGLYGPSAVSFRPPWCPPKMSLSKANPHGVPLSPYCVPAWRAF